MVGNFIKSYKVVRLGPEGLGDFSELGETWYSSLSRNGLGPSSSMGRDLTEAASRVLRPRGPSWCTSLVFKLAELWFKRQDHSQPRLAVQRRLRRAVLEPQAGGVWPQVVS